MENSLYNSLNDRAAEIGRGKRGECRTGLVVQGGGMRGTYSMAALMALEEVGLGGAFDQVVASSAGAINAAYMLAGQAKLAVTVYLDDISNRNFIDFLRLRKVVDIDFLVDGVLKRHKALDTANVKASSTTLHIVLTSYATGQPVEVTNKDTDIDIMEALRATAALPILYNRIVKIRGEGYVDGGVADSVPLLRILKMGCKDVVIVLTRPPDFRRKAPTFFQRMIQMPFTRKYPEALRRVLNETDHHFNRTMDVIQNPALAGDGVRLFVIAPSDMKRMVSRTTSDRNRLLDCALMARNDVRRALGLEPLNDNPFG